MNIIRRVLPILSAWLFPLALLAQTAPLCLPQTDEIYAGKYVRRLHFHHIPTAEARAGWENAGCTLMSWSDHAYTALLPASWTLEQLYRLGADSITRWLPEDKLPPFRLSSEVAPHRDYVEVSLQIYPHYPTDIVHTALQQLGAIHILTLHRDCLRARVPQNRLYDIARLPCIHLIAPISAKTAPEDTDGRAIQQSNALDSDHPLGRHYNGAGTGILIRDDGMVGPHIDFKGRITNWTTGANIPANSHGDRVSGIAGGAGNADPQQKGMATGTHLYITNYDPFFDDLTLQKCVQYNIGITNSSYSDGCNTTYSMEARGADQQLADHPWLMHVFSAGNSNGANCGYGAGSQWGNITGGNKMAKNSLMAGNIDQYELIAGNSSRGPAYDGRVKPDICTYGSNQVSTGPDHTYQVFGGTSAAAPGLSGLLAQLSQAWETLHPQLPVPATLLKTVLLNTATDVGQPGPDFIYGWGKANGLRAVECLESHQHDDFTLDHQQTWSRLVTIPAGQRNARFMIGWTDPPAEVNASHALVNDLDLTVTGPGGTLYRPLILNHLPNTNTLNAPAQPGRDSINNTEQVSINYPAPGVYLVQVKGHSVPLGPQDGYMTWHYRDNDIRVTWPNGGESLVPGETVMVRWETMSPELPVEIALSTDNGATYAPPISLPAYSLPNTPWTVPQALTGQARLRIRQGGLEDHSDYPFYIAPLPVATAVSRVCPDSATLIWQLFPDTLAAEVWTLGGQYMEPVGTTMLRQYTFAHPAEMPLWAAARAVSADGSIEGRRSVAEYWPGGLKNCPQTFDVALRSIKWPGSAGITACLPLLIAPGVQIVNEGIFPVTGASITADIGTGTPLSAILPVIPPGDSLLFTFPEAFLLTENLTDTLSIFIQHPGDSYLPNNTIRQPLSVTVEPQSGSVAATFESWPLRDWTVSNPDGGITWAPVPDAVTGPWGNQTHVLGIEHYFYSTAGAEDGLWLPPLQLDAMPAPVLRFHYAHAQYSDGTSEGLRVELYPACDTIAPPVIIWGKNDPELSSMESGSYFTPQHPEDWKTAIIDLSPWQSAGSVRLRMVAVNDYGNNTYIDNLGVDAAVANAPVAIINAPERICSPDPLMVTADTVGQWLFTRYEWNFGLDAHPASATGPGPHHVTFDQSGPHFLTLNAYYPQAADSTTALLWADSLPNARFEAQMTGPLSVQFVPDDLNATQYDWNFGDGNTTSEQQPLHQFLTWGNYEVALTTHNACGDAQESKFVGVSGSTTDEARTDVGVYPNPTGSFALITWPLNVPLTCSVTDMKGQNWFHLQSDGLQEYLFLPVIGWPAGMYRIQLVSDRKAISLPLLVAPVR